MAKAAATLRRPVRFVRTRAAAPVRSPIHLRQATAADADVIHGLILDHLAEGHLLPRDRDEISAHVSRFVVAVQHDVVVACAELAPLSGAVGEVRSFVVSRQVRSVGVGRRLIDALVAAARDAGLVRLCAFTHSPGYFVHLGFSLVPHTWLPEKIATDCHGCTHFRACGQYAVLRSLVNHG